jgi:DNA-binding NarL/FixJ family response regulator
MSAPACPDDHRTDRFAGEGSGAVPGEPVIGSGQDGPADVDEQAPCLSRNPLSPREREIARHVALGLRNAEIGSRLGITEKTVMLHVTHIRHKLGARSRQEVAAHARRFGLL